MSNKELRRRLAVIFTNEEPYRYVPKAIPGRESDSYGWDVFDRKENRFITSKKEIMAMSFDDCCEQLAN
jgi:hypothetical protein